LIACRPQQKERLLHPRGKYVGKIMWGDHSFEVQHFLCKLEVSGKTVNDGNVSKHSKSNTAADAANSVRTECQLLQSVMCNSANVQRQASHSNI
jgi:hypothetical protein